MFIRYLNLFNKHMNGITYSFIGGIGGTVYGVYTRDLTSNIEPYNPFSIYTILGAILGYYVGWHNYPIIKYPQ